MGVISQSVERKIRASFAAQSMMETMGAALTGLAEGHAEITSEVPNGARQQHGFGHAGLTFAIGDSAAGYAALTVLPQEAEVLTAEMKINLLAPARGERLVATGRVIKPGRRLVVVSAEVAAVENGEQRLIALLQGTMVPLLPD